MKQELKPRTHRADIEQYDKLGDKLKKIDLGISEVLRDMVEEANDASNKSIVDRNKKMKRRRI